MHGSWIFFPWSWFSLWNMVVLRSDRYGSAWSKPNQCLLDYLASQRMEDHHSLLVLYSPKRQDNFVNTESLMQEIGRRTRVAAAIQHNISTLILQQYARATHLLAPTKRHDHHLLRTVPTSLHDAHARGNMLNLTNGIRSAGLHLGSLHRARENGN